jgi:phage terminase large subunit-like protein
VPAQQPDITVDSLFGLALRGLEDSIKRPNILTLGEKPYPEQDRFFKSQKMGRFVSGGNRGGKTDAIVIDGVLTAINQHPHRPRNPAWGNGAVQLRYVVPDVATGVTQTMVPKFRRWVPDEYLRGGSWERAWDPNNYIIHFENGSTIDFVTHGMQLLKLGSVPRHAIYFDEEPPQDIFNESMMRLVDYEGFWCIAATPTRGFTWTHDLLWEPARDVRDPRHEWIDTFVLDAASNPFNIATSESMNRYFVGMSTEERAIRESGDFVSRTGRVFPSFSEEANVIPADQLGVPPKSWTWYTSVDFGYNNPTAWLWHAVSPQGDIVTFAEHYASGMLVPQHSAVVKMREQAWGKEADFRVGDPHGDQTVGTGQGMSYISEYAQRGLYIGTHGIPRGEGAVMIRIEKMQQYFAPRKNSGWGTNRPKWVISSNCTNFIKELKRLQFDSYQSDKTAYSSNKKETVASKDDHAFDSAGYFATLMPDLAPEMPKLETETIGYGDLLQKVQDGEAEFAIMRAGDGDKGWQQELEEWY